MNPDVGTTEDSLLVFETTIDSLTPAPLRLVEEEKFVVDYRQGVALEPTTNALRFSYADLFFDATDPASINDAFEAAFVDANGNSVHAQ